MERFRREPAYFSSPSSGDEEEGYSTPSHVENLRHGSFVENPQEGGEAVVDVEPFCRSADSLQESLQKDGFTTDSVGQGEGVFAVPETREHTIEEAKNEVMVGVKSGEAVRGGGGDKVCGAIRKEVVQSVEMKSEESPRHEMGRKESPPCEEMKVEESHLPEMKKQSFPPYEVSAFFEGERLDLYEDEAKATSISSPMASSFVEEVSVFPEPPSIKEFGVLPFSKDVSEGVYVQDEESGFDAKQCLSVNGGRGASALQPVKFTAFKRESDALTSSDEEEGAAHTQSALASLSVSHTHREAAAPIQASLHPYSASLVHTHLEASTPPQATSHSSSDGFSSSAVSSSRETNSNSAEYTDAAALEATIVKAAAHTGTSQLELDPHEYPPSPYRTPKTGSIPPLSGDTAAPVQTAPTPHSDSLTPLKPPHIFHETTTSANPSFSNYIVNGYQISNYKVKPPPPKSHSPLDGMGSWVEGDSNATPHSLSHTPWPREKASSDNQFSESPLDSLDIQGQKRGSPPSSLNTQSPSKATTPHPPLSHSRSTNSTPQSPSRANPHHCQQFPSTATACHPPQSPLQTTPPYPTRPPPKATLNPPLISEATVSQDLIEMARSSPEALVSMFKKRVKELNKLKAKLEWLEKKYAEVVIENRSFSSLEALLSDMFEKVSLPSSSTFSSSSLGLNKDTKGKDSLPNADSGLKEKLLCLNQYLANLIEERAVLYQFLNMMFSNDEEIKKHEKSWESPIDFNILRQKWIQYEAIFHESAQAAHSIAMGSVLAKEDEIKSLMKENSRLVYQNEKLTKAVATINNEKAQLMVNQLIASKHGLLQTKSQFLMDNLNFSDSKSEPLKHEDKEASPSAKPNAEAAIQCVLLDEQIALADSLRNQKDNVVSVSTQTEEEEAEYAENSLEVEAPEALIAKSPVKEALSFQPEVDSPVSANAVATSSSTISTIPIKNPVFSEGGDPEPREGAMHQGEAMLLKMQLSSLQKELQDTRLQSHSLLASKDSSIERYKERISDLEKELAGDGFIVRLAEKQANRESDTQRLYESIYQLQTSLNEQASDLNLERDQTTFLKKRIRELEQSLGRQSVNMDYVKHVVTKYVEYTRKGDSVANTLLPVIATVLYLNEEERQQFLM